MTKKILLAFDGSGMNPAVNGANQFSNILKLHLLAGGSIDPDKTKENVPNQISLYNIGIGGESRSTFAAAVYNALGMLGQQTRPLMKRLEDVYEEGDQLYVIGFSRGASSARQFVVELEENGLFTASGKKVEDPPVEFLGCFDTVSEQMWNPFQRFGIYYRLITGGIVPSTVLGEKNGQLPSIVKKAVQNLSLDDPRFRSFPPFNPVHMDSKDDRVHEVWFPGNHSDVGGGYADQGVSDGSGKFMQQFMEQAGMVFLTPEQVGAESFVVPDHPEIEAGPEDFDFSPDPTADSHSGATNSLRPVLSVSKNEVIENATVRIHESLLELIQSDSPKVIKAVSGDETETIPYVINPSVTKTDFVVVGDLDVEIPEKTEQLKKALQ